MRFLLAVAAALFFVGAVAAGPAAAQTTSTVTRPDGTVIKTTINGLNDIRISITGGPDFTNNPADVTFSEVLPTGDIVKYTGTITQGGTTTPFTCTLNTVTKTVTGTGACDLAFSSESGGSSTPTTPSTPSTPTTPTTPTGTGTTTTNTDGSTTTTTTTSDGTVVTVTVGDQAVISAVEADQLILALLGDRLTSQTMQSFVASRIQALSLAALAPAPRRMTSNGGYVGRSAGAEALGLGVWVNATGTYTDTNRPGSAQDGWTGAGALGVDMMMENAVVGAYAGYDSTDLDGPGLNYGSDGWTIGAYGSWSSSPAFRVTAAIGYGQHDVDYRRQTTGVLSFGSTNRDQVFGSLAIESQIALTDRWVAIPSLAISASSSKTDGYTDNAGRRIGSVNSDLTTAILGGSLFYRGDRFLPYLSASLNEDLDDQPGVDGSYGVIGAGFAAPLADGLSIAVGVQRLVGKTYEEETTVGATLRRGF